MDAARQGAEDAGQRERHHLVERGVDTHHRGALLVLADGDEAEAEAAARQPEDRQRRQHEQAERQLVEEPVVVERRQHQADVLAGQLDVRDDRRHHLRQRQRGDREVVALQAQHRDAERAREDDAEHHAEAEAERERQMPLHHRDGDAVAAEAVEDGVAERRVAGVAADDVPALRQHREQQRVDAELDQRVGAEPRQRREHGERHDDQERIEAPHVVESPAFTPSARAGRSAARSAPATGCRSSRRRRRSGRCRASSATRRCRERGRRRSRRAGCRGRR